MKSTRWRCLNIDINYPKKIEHLKVRKIRQVPRCLSIKVIFTKIRWISMVPLRPPPLLCQKAEWYEEEDRKQNSKLNFCHNFSIQETAAAESWRGC